MRPRILFVEDEESTHFAVSEYFRAKGYWVDCARSREEALGRLSETRYPVVIADLRLSERDARSAMPDGLALVERVRRDHPETRVLVLTACGAELEAEARRLGADAYLQKPQSLDHVAHLVEMLCGGEAMPEEGEPRGGTDPTAGPRSARARKKILIVDDSSTVLLMEKSLLSRSYDVISARDGREGVAKASAELPDLILMDVMMPEMDGFTAVRSIRARPETKDIPVIMVSTRGELKNVESGYESGCNDYVTKPFSGVELLAKVKSCFQE